MDVFEFDKTLLMRLDECSDILNHSTHCPASRVKQEWTYFVELQVEPLGKCSKPPVNNVKKVFAMNCN